MTKQFSNYSDLITFTRASKGHALRPVSYGDEIINNGDFELGDNGDWGVSTNWTISGGVATLVGGDGVYGNSGLYQVIDLDVGKIYKVSLDVSGLTGTFRVYHASYSTGTNIDSTGTLVFNIVGESGGTRLNILGNNGSAVTLDNISVKEVTFDQPDGTLTLFEHPENVPRVEYDADGNRLGLLVEEARTNLITYSTPDSNWTPSRVTITENNAVSPDGTENATRINETTATNSHYISGNETSVTSGLNYTLSVYVKADTSTACQLLFSSTGFGSSQYANFDLSTGTVGYEAANATATIQDVGNGWYRCAITSTATATTFSIVGFVVFVNNNASSSTRIPPYAGNTAHQMYVYGAQVEEASFPTSYIKNEGTSSGATRSADVASIPVADFGYNQSAGSLLWEGSFLSDVAETDYLYNINNNSGSPTNVADSIRAFKFGDGDLNYRVSVSSLSSVNSEFTGVTENLFKVAYALDSSSYSTTRDGGAIAEDTSVAIPTGLTTLHIGPDFSGHIKSIKYYPRRLTNAQLQDITS